MKILFRSILLPISLATGASLLTTTAIADETAANDGSNCRYNTTTPIIPDGNIATKDELVSAQKRVKYFQETLLDFRECLFEAEQALDVTAADYDVKKAALLARSDESIDLENKVASEFNEAIQIYKAR